MMKLYMKKKGSKNIVGVTGEYLVCAELGKLGILALLTPKNNPLFDIVAVSPDAEKSVFIQVKTSSTQNKEGWRFGKDICSRKNNRLLYTVLVDLKEGGSADCYIYEYDVLSERVENMYSNYLSTKKRDGKDKKDVDFRWFDFRNFSEDDFNRKNSWNLLGFPD